MPPQWQIRFDGGHQQRYLPDRQSVLRYVLSIGASAPGKRFEVFTEAAPVRLSDGSPGGRTFSLVETIDLNRTGEAERLQAELTALTRDKNPARAPARPVSRPGGGDAQADVRGDVLPPGGGDAHAVRGDVLPPGRGDAHAAGQGDAHAAGGQA